MGDLSERNSVGSLCDLLDFLGQPLEQTCKNLDAERRRCAPSFSALGYFPNNETKQTAIIGSLLRPTEKHGQGTLFLRHLLSSAWPSTGPEDWPEEVLQRAKVRLNHFIPADYRKGKCKRFVDLWIQIGKDRCLAIESKARDADDQLEQLDAYVEFLKRSFPAPSTYMLLYLSSNGGEPSQKSIAAEAWERERLAGNADARPYVPFIGQWLEACKVGCEAERVKFFIDDFVAFIDSNERRTVPMTTALNPSIRDVLFDVQQESRRATLLSIWEQSDQIYEELVRIFQVRLCERLAELEIGYALGDNDGLLSKTEWGGRIRGPQLEFLAGGERLLAYAEIQRCPSGSHKTSRHHFIIGINIQGLETNQSKLRPWRELAQLSGFPVGTDDRNWVWQQIPDGFDDLRSKDSAIRLMDPVSPADIAEQMQDALMRFVEIARGMECE